MGINKPQNSVYNSAITFFYYAFKMLYRQPRSFYIQQFFNTSPITQAVIADRPKFLTCFGIIAVKGIPLATGSITLLAAPC